MTQCKINILFKNGSSSLITVNNLKLAYEYVRNNINYKLVDVVFIEENDNSYKVHDQHWDWYSNMKAKEMPK